MRSSHRGMPQLSPQALSIWAKSVYQDPLDTRYLQLWQHMEDTGAIAAHVWDDFLPCNVRSVLADDIGNEEMARDLYLFVATIHDVGKASPAFAVQVPEFADKIRMHGGLRIEPAIAADSLRSKFRHELVGYQALHEWFRTQGASTEEGSFADGVACIVAGHHGTSLTSEKRELLNDSRAEEFIGDRAWSVVRSELLDWIAVDFAKTLQHLQDRPLRRRTQILLTGLVIIADWIASDTRLFPLNEGPLDEQCFDPHRRAERAWRMLRLPRPWTPPVGMPDPDEAFAGQFDIPNARLRPVQREAIRMAQSMAKPGLMIIEANMGEGKTEAALLAAEILAARFRCGGVYYALPTQATVNAMFTRVLDWVGHLPAEQKSGMASLFLAHGKRALNDEYERMREQWFDDGSGLDGDFQKEESRGLVYDDGWDSGSAALHQSMQAVVNAWLTGPKRGNLSDFVVGTIDQVLMAGLRSKHVVLRHLALAGKVVILDEIHSNTAYMNVYMETVLAWLGAYGTPVIMLSATLPQQRRQAFLHAYRQGARATRDVESLTAAFASGESVDIPVRRRRRRFDAAAHPTADGLGERDGKSTETDLDLRYPLISQAAADGILDSAPAPSGRSLGIHVALIADDDATLVKLLREQLHDGGCAVVIRNTVSRAQHTYELLSRALDVDVTLAHSRFLAFDRARIDRELIRRYGKNSGPRQRRGIVVATQVVEQSLDVDFDLMITDIAPIDLILQRAGRLHRHRRGDGESDRPNRLRTAKLFITGVTGGLESGEPPEFASRVYARYLLMRSLAVTGLTAFGDAVRMNVPSDIPRMVQNVYGEDADVCPPSWRSGPKGEKTAKRHLAEQREHSENMAGQLRIFNPQWKRSPFSLDNWLAVNLPDPDTPGISQQRLVAAGVRETDDSFEVIVLQRDEDGNLQLPYWGEFDETALPAGMAEPPSRQQVRDILSCAISLGPSALNYVDIDDAIEALELAVPDQWRTYMTQNRNLTGQLLVVLDHSGEAQYTLPSKTKGGKLRKATTMRFRYSKEKGWQTDAE